MKRKNERKEMRGSAVRQIFLVAESTEWSHGLMVHRASVKPRKTPQQARSREMEKSILKAAEEVLVERGGLQFTTNHVAKQAGISVGSLYQYFPNKGAILHRLEISEMESTVAGLLKILQKSASHEDRLREAIRFFFETEYKERKVRSALKEVRSLFDSTAEVQRIQGEIFQAVHDFLVDWNTSAGSDGQGPEVTRQAAELLIVTVSALAESVSDREKKSRILWWAEECFQMLHDRLQQLLAV